MFTGLVEDLGRVVGVEADGDGARITIATALAPGLELGDSVAVNGACMTVVTHDAESFAADVMRESLSRTTLGSLADGSKVNLERPLKVEGRLDGHIVQGHVDGVGTVAAATEDGFARRLRITLPPELAALVVEKGSIAVDGVSLTVSAVGDDHFEVSLIPETLERTTLGDLRAGSDVNLEADILAKHVERLLRHPQN